jgi:hypothetical protein
MAVKKNDQELPDVLEVFKLLMDSMDGMIKVAQLQQEMMKGMAEHLEIVSNHLVDLTMSVQRLEMKP